MTKRLHTSCRFIEKSNVSHIIKVEGVVMMTGNESIALIVLMLSGSALVVLFSFLHHYFIDDKFTRDRLRRRVRKLRLSHMLRFMGIPMKRYLFRTPVDVISLQAGGGRVGGRAGGSHSSGPALPRAQSSLHGPWQRHQPQRRLGACRRRPGDRAEPHESNFAL